MENMKEKDKTIEPDELNNNDSQNYYRNMKLVIVLIASSAIYFTTFGEVNKFDRMEIVFSCDFIEQFVEIYEMDKLCSDAFADNVIKRYEYWSISWKLKTIQDIWNKDIENDKGKPALKINSKTNV